MVYRCVPEEKCRSGGFDENDNDIETSGNRQRLFSVSLHCKVWEYQYLVSILGRTCISQWNGRLNVKS